MATRLHPLASAVTVDLSHGRIELQTPSLARAVAVPAAWLARAVAALGDGVDPLAKSLAESIAKDAAIILDGTNDPAPEEVAYAIALAFGQRGLGIAAFERFGDALTLLWNFPPATDASFHRFAATLVGQVVTDVTGVPTQAAVLSTQSDGLTLFLGAAAACAFVRERANRGEAGPQILATLLGGASA
ncbi:MAG: hypothetical protein JWM10_3918 [Myxococcaceae bacterium]|nr:hypothetical protein [Myxococcaceae bacterium]